MSNNNLILRTVNSPWTTPTTDFTKNSVLSHTNVDNNFIYLRGELIYTAQTIGNTVTLKKINGNDLSFNVGSGGSVYWTSGSSGNYSVKVINDSTINATGNYSVAEGFSTTASGNASHAEGYFTNASGNYSHAEGATTTAAGIGSHAEGLSTIASGDYSHAEGSGTLASEESSHAEGGGTIASGSSAHAEGFVTIAGGDYSHSEGNETIASGNYSHAEGYQTVASGIYSHAGGYQTTADGVGSHAEGVNTRASGSGSHAGGNDSVASGVTSFIHSANSLVTGNRSVVLGGQNITGTTDDTVYVPNLEVRGQAYTPIYDNLTGGTTFIPDWDNSNVQILTLSGNTSVSGGTSTMEGGSAYTVIVKQSNGGSHTITWDSTYKFEGGSQPTLSTADGSVDIITFICDGAFLYGLIAKDFQ